MMKTSVRIGAFEIDDAELHGESPGERTLTIPCKSDPDLCMQLDAWDAETSVPVSYTHLRAHETAGPCANLSYTIV